MVTKSLLAKLGFRHNGLKHNLPSLHNMATSHCLIWEKQRCYAEAAISNLHLIFISRAENNWMSHLLTQFHSANYSLVIFFSFPPLTTAFWIELMKSLVKLFWRLLIPSANYPLNTNSEKSALKKNKVRLILQFSENKHYHGSEFQNLSLWRSWRHGCSVLTVLQVTSQQHQSHSSHQGACFSCSQSLLLHRGAAQVLHRSLQKTRCCSCSLVWSSKTHTRWARKSSRSSLLFRKYI